MQIAGRSFWRVCPRKHEGKRTGGFWRLARNSYVWQNLNLTLRLERVIDER